MVVNKETPIAMLTVGQLQEVLRAIEEPREPQPTDYTKGYVYGLKGIRQIFNVAHATAQRYKDTFLKPAVKQNGKKIVVDVAKAMELFDEYNRGDIK